MTCEHWHRRGTTSHQWKVKEQTSLNIAEEKVRTIKLAAAQTVVFYETQSFCKEAERIELTSHQAFLWKRKHAMHQNRSAPFCLSSLQAGNRNSFHSQPLMGTCVFGVKVVSTRPLMCTWWPEYNNGLPPCVTPMNARFHQLLQYMHPLHASQPPCYIHVRTATSRLGRNVSMHATFKSKLEFIWSVLKTTSQSPLGYFAHSIPNSVNPSFCHSFFVCWIKPDPPVLLWQLQFNYLQRCYHCWSFGQRLVNGVRGSEDEWPGVTPKSLATSRARDTLTHIHTEWKYKRKEKKGADKKVSLDSTVRLSRPMCCSTENPSIKFACHCKIPDVPMPTDNSKVAALGICLIFEFLSIMTELPFHVWT